MSSSLQSSSSPASVSSAQSLNIKALAQRISSHFKGYFRDYAKWKLRTDPLYEAVREVLQGTTQPILDIGCGLGLLAFYLRESGIQSPIHGLDFDTKKIALAKLAAVNYQPAPQFEASDMRKAWPEVSGHLCLLDVLQYVPTADRVALVDRASQHVDTGGTFIIRSSLKEDTWRWHFTRITDRAANLISWMKAVPHDYPTQAELVESAAAQGLHLVKAQPLWGKTPFNTYLLVFQRPQEGSTQV
jgi:trans-aconitate methyltransferase